MRQLKLRFGDIWWLNEERHAREFVGYGYWVAPKLDVFLQVQLPLFPEQRENKNNVIAFVLKKAA